MIDRLGQRLRRGSWSEEDLRMLDDYRRSFGPAYEAVMETLVSRLGLEPSGRPAKSTPAIVRKLFRETIRLSQIQDIAGCRIVVADIGEQDAVVEAITAISDDTVVYDRRINPSHGYRAVHMVEVTRERPVEIQVRTALQHSWAELSEAYADLIDPDLKYGGGPQASLETLRVQSNAIRDVELLEADAIQSAGVEYQRHRNAIDWAKAVSLQAVSHVIDDLRRRHG